SQRTGSARRSSARRRRIANHALVFALGAGPVGPAGPRGEAVVSGQVEKALIELGGLPICPELQDRRLLVIHQHLARHTAEVLQAADQPFVGVLGVFLVGAPEVKTARVAQRVDDEMHLEDFPASSVVTTDQSLCNCRPGSVSKRTVVLPARKARLGP